jgi:hypothetical protein
MRKAFSMKTILFPLILAAGLSFSATLVVGEGEMYSTPQMAIDAVTDGDTILIRAGTYESDASIELWGHSDVCILGEEGSKLVCTGSIENVLWIINSDRITVSGLHATHMMPSEDERCYGNVFGLDGCDEILIENCDINGCGAIGVYACLMGELILRNNFIHDNTIWAIQFEGHDLLQEYDGVTGLILEGNTLINNGGTQLDMIYSEGSSTGELIGVNDEDGHIVFLLKEAFDDTPVRYYLLPGCEGPWLDIVQRTDDYLGSTLELQWREVLTYFPLYYTSYEVYEITSVTVIE